jgi:predicted Zn finger-like uncharacterized protein
MLAGCPKCKTKYRIGDKVPGNEGIVLRCGKCRCLFRISARQGSPVVSNSTGCCTEKRIKVLVANESSTFCDTVEKVLSGEPFDIFTCNDGKSALTAIEEMIPDVALIDVALPGMYGFEVCEAVRKNPVIASVKIILIAAIYDKTRYKREPNSLYGADDFIEKHNIPDALATKIYRLVSGGDLPEKVDGANMAGEEASQMITRELSASEKQDMESSRDAIRHDEERESVPDVPAEEEEAHFKARRLARLIASDIALYNEDLVDEGVRNDSFYKLLEEDVREGRALYERRIPEEVRKITSYLEDAFEELISRKKRELNLSIESGVRGA